MLRRAGKRPFRVEFQRATITTNALGHQVESPWTALCAAWVDKLDGRGSERREAAALGSVRATTFVANWTPTLDGVTERDRIVHAGVAWDIKGIANKGRNQVIEFTATSRGA
jgi:hypothetical protein